MAVDCIYLAAGRGVRCGLGYPKQLARLGGRPMLLHGLDTLRVIPEIGHVVVVAPPGEREAFWEVIRPHVEDGEDDVCVVDGGATRRDSTRNALRYVTARLVMVTEAVRPFVTEDLIRRVLAVKAPSVTAWLPASASVCDRGGCFAVDRSQIGEVQMPQAFTSEVLRSAHNNGSDAATCDAMLVYETLGIAARTVEGDPENIKVTHPVDLYIAEAIHRARRGDRGE